MWREQRRCLIRQKTSQPIPIWGSARVISSSGLLVLACRGQARSGQIESADQLHRTAQGLEAAVPMIADVHHPSRGRTITVKDVEFLQGEIRVRRPSVRHPAELRDQGLAIGSRDQSSRYVRRTWVSSPLPDRWGKARTRNSSRSGV